MRFEPVIGWEANLRVHHGLGEIAGVVTDSSGLVYIFHRGPCPVFVADSHGNLLNAWGESQFVRPHGIVPVSPEREEAFLPPKNVTPAGGFKLLGQNAEFVERTLDFIGVDDPCGGPLLFLRRDDGNDGGDEQQGEADRHRRKDDAVEIAVADRHATKL